MNGGKRQHLGTVLVRIDIAVSASEITSGKDMEKDVSGLLGKGDGSFHKMRWSVCDGSYPVKFLSAFLAFMSSSFVNLRRAVIYSAKIR